MTFFCKHFIPQPEEGLLDGEMEEPASEDNRCDTDPEHDIAIVAQSVSGQCDMQEMDQLFVRQVDGIGQGGDKRGDPGGVPV